MKKGAKEQKEARRNIQPIGDRILVRREELKEKSAAGIIIPDTAKTEKSKIGVVIAVGPGRFGEQGDLIPMTVRAGVKVIFNAGWDNEVDLGDDEEYFLVKESDILAVIK